MHRLMTNPNHKQIKELAVQMLFSLQHCPTGQQKVCNELLPIASFTNGIYTPNNHPPVAVYVTLDGVRWRFTKHSKRWQKA